MDGESSGLMVRWGSFSTNIPVLLGTKIGRAKSCYELFEPLMVSQPFEWHERGAQEWVRWIFAAFKCRKEVKRYGARMIFLQ